MTSLDERVIEDLSTLAMDRCKPIMTGVLQLVDSPQQKMIISTNVAAFMFGLAARFLQHHWQDKGEKPTFEQAVDAVTHHVARLCIAEPPPDLPAAAASEDRSNG